MQAGAADLRRDGHPGVADGHHPEGKVRERAAQVPRAELPVRPQREGEPDGHRRAQRESQVHSETPPDPEAGHEDQARDHVENGMAAIVAPHHAPGGDRHAGEEALDDEIPPHLVRPEPSVTASDSQLRHRRSASAHQETERDPDQARGQGPPHAAQRELQHHGQQRERCHLTELPVPERRAGGAEHRGEGGYRHLPGGRGRPQRGQHHPGGETPEEPVQLSQGMKKRSVREQAVYRLVDLTQPEREKQPGKDAGPGEHCAEWKEQTVGLSSQHDGKPAAPPRFTQLRLGPALAGA